MKRALTVIAIVVLIMPPLSARAANPCYICLTLGQAEFPDVRSNQVSCEGAPPQENGREGCEEHNAVIGPGYCRMYDANCVGVYVHRGAGLSIDRDLTTVEALNEHSDGLAMFLAASHLMTEDDLATFLDETDRQSANAPTAYDGAVHRYSALLAKVSAVTGQRLTPGELLVVPTESKNSGRR
jgi:hypothetical protein